MDDAKVENEDIRMVGERERIAKRREQIASVIEGKCKENVSVLPYSTALIWNSEAILPGEDLPWIVDKLIRLIIIRDLSLNIRTYFEKVDERYLLIRDAREACENPKEEQRWAYATLCFSYLRACEVILELEGKEKPDFVKTGTEIVNEIKNADNPYALYKEFVEDKILKLLIKDELKNKEEAEEKLKLAKQEEKEKLKFAKDFVGLDIPLCDVGTINRFSLENSYVDLAELEIACGLTQGQITAQLSGYNTIESKADGWVGPSWFMNLKDWQKQFVFYYKDKFTSGDIIPTQLRTTVAGLRNLWCKSNYIIDENELILINSFFHCGAIPFFGKNKSDVEPVSCSNISQLVQYSCLDEDVEKTILMSLNTKPNERSILSITQEQIENYAGNSKSGLSYLNIPMNELRRIQGIHNIDKVLLCELNIFNNDDDDIKQDGGRRGRKTGFFTNNRRALNDFYQDLPQKFAHKEMAEWFKDVCDYYIQTNKAMTNNNNLEIAVFFSLAKTIKNSELSKLVISCKSGKDRTGMISFGVTMKLVEIYLCCKTERRIYLLELQEKIAKTLAQGGHVQFLAGFCGGSLGAFGLKRFLIGTGFGEKADDLLFLPTARQNKEVSAKTNNPIIDFVMK